MKGLRDGVVREWYCQLYLSPEERQTLEAMRERITGEWVRDKLSKGELARRAILYAARSYIASRERANEQAIRGVIASQGSWP